jgi:single-strand DNA-binding protein
MEEQMNDTVITIHGHVVGEVVTRTTQSGVPMATFRVASTPRRPGRSRGEWVDGPTSVACWRALAINVGESLHTGSALIVHGRLTQRPVSRQVGGETVKSVSADIDAFSVGPDLNLGPVRLDSDKLDSDKSAPVRQAEQRALREAAMAMHPAGSARLAAPAPAPAPAVAQQPFGPDQLGAA